MDLVRDRQSEEYVAPRYTSFRASFRREWEGGETTVVADLFLTVASGRNVVGASSPAPDSEEDESRNGGELSSAVGDANVGHGEAAENPGCMICFDEVTRRRARVCCSNGSCPKVFHGHCMED